ncbi:gas vesicle protein [Actinacidiphila acidipaludis]|uniref:Gas vesicle protein n=1 Tax=Actinacidiphila acidipaludis TaxID=2873382 RepID=A0ABS7QHS3_9ACTN|nr:gas vesicle protein [Streptomyces acidipaludis]MBY8882229.1 gas vesicle protein [Streptomyces acidipaludis]
MTSRAPSSAAAAGPGPERQVALVDLLDRVLAGGVVISGEVVLGIADVDLVRISLRALVASIRAVQEDEPASAPFAETDPR